MVKVKFHSKKEFEQAFKDNPNEIMVRQHDHSANFFGPLTNHQDYLCRRDVFITNDRHIWSARLIWLAGEREWVVV